MQSMNVEGTLLYEPSTTRIQRSRLTAFSDWAAKHYPVSSQGNYEKLHAWSIARPDEFWSAIWRWFDITADGSPKRALVDQKMPGATWFPDIALNYAELALRRGDELAVITTNERGETQEFSRNELYRLTARLANGLRRAGVAKGDYVAGFVGNGVEALAAFLATASLGAVWSSVSPEFGVASVLDRFGQLKPKVLFATTTYEFAGKRFDRTNEVRQIRDGLSSLVATVTLPHSAPVLGTTNWDAFLGGDTPISFERVPFAHPLWVLYSSGTTGLPKAIVQGHGGIVLEHLKALALHCDLSEGDRFFWFTTTGWMMWNFLVGGLLLGVTVVLYDGSPSHPDLGILWRMAEDLRINYFGTSAPYLQALQKNGHSIKDQYNLASLQTIGSTGAPLPADTYVWAYEHLSNDMMLSSISGGSDVCTAFLSGCPWLPVHTGELQCAALGCAVESWNERGQRVHDQVGELVITTPMPSMPLYFLNDPDGRRLDRSYFDVFPGVWRHGDWVKHTRRGSFVVYGRSDSTLNRGGVRMGTSEFYRVVESDPRVQDSLVVDTSSLELEGRLWLFVVLAPGWVLDETIEVELKKQISRQISPRHIPDEIRSLESIPRTLNGKKIEVPIKRLLAGEPAHTALNLDTVKDRSTIEPFLKLAKELSP